MKEFPDRTQTGLASKAQRVVGVNVAGITMGKALPLVIDGGEDVDQVPARDVTTIMEDGMPNAQGVDEVAGEPEDSGETLF